nr:hypothetical protein [uncultured Carboxylicivirga sp.]
MAQPYQYNGFPNGFGYPQPYNGQSYVANNFRPQYHNSRPRKKSGCKYNPNAKNGAEVMTGWNKSRKGFMSFIASPHKTKSKIKHPNGGNTELWMVKITMGIQEVWHTGFFNPTTKKLTIPALTMVANPNAANGGYFGTYLKRR